MPNGPLSKKLPLWLFVALQANVRFCLICALVLLPLCCIIAERKATSTRTAITELDVVLVARPPCAKPRSADGNKRDWAIPLCLGREPNYPDRHVWCYVPGGVLLFLYCLRSSFEISCHTGQVSTWVSKNRKDFRLVPCASWAITSKRRKLLAGHGRTCESKRRPKPLFSFESEANMDLHRLYALPAEKWWWDTNTCPCRATWLGSFFRTRTGPYFLSFWKQLLTLNQMAVFRILAGDFGAE